MMSSTIRKPCVSTIRCTLFASCSSSVAEDTASQKAWEKSGGPLRPFHLKILTKLQLNFALVFSQFGTYTSNIRWRGA
jgi:hypothetical protein